MTKKHLIGLADEMRHILSGPGMVSKQAVIENLCDFMRKQNPAFNETRWKDYLAGNCGPSGGRIKK